MQEITSSSSQQTIAIAEAAARLSSTKKTVYSLHRSDPTFPRIFKLSEKKSVVLAAELDAWIAQRRKNHRIDGRGGEQ